MADFVVTTLKDETSDDTTLSLREAAELANAQAGTDSITFAPGLNGVLRLTQGVIVISGDVSIDGAGRITISGDTAGDDVLDADGLTDARDNLNRSDNTLAFKLSESETAAALDGLTITGAGLEGPGKLTFSNGALTGNHLSGFVLNELTLIGSEVRNNVGITPISANTVTVIDSTLSGNGGGYHVIRSNGDSLTVIGSMISGNMTSGGGSQVIYSRGDATLIDTTVFGNRGYQEFETQLVYGAGVIRAHENLTLSQTTIANNRFSSYHYVAPALSAGRDTAIYSSTIAGNINYLVGSPDRQVISETAHDNIANNTFFDINDASASLTLSNSIVFGVFVGRTRSDIPPTLAELSSSGANVLNDTLTSPDGTETAASLSDVFAEIGELEQRGVTFYVPVLDQANGTAALRRAANNPVLNASTDALPSEANLGVDIDRDGVLSTDPISTDANGNPRIVGGAMDLGPVEVQNIKPARLRIIGDEADNTLTDAVGNDNFFGRGGSDTFVLIADGLADNIKDFELGSDRIDLSAWNVTSFDALSFREHPTDKLILTYGDEVLSIRATDGPLAEADITADSFIFAEAQSAPPVRLVQGTDAGEKLYGTALDETLIDGAGKDNLFGRSGADTLVLVVDGVVDNIKDFELGVDQIDHPPGVLPASPILISAFATIERSSSGSRVRY